jgi:hypothetical protein
MKDVNAVFRTAEHVGTDPLLVSQLVAMAIDGSALDTLRHLLASGQVPPEDLATIHLPDGVSYRTLLRRAFRMEEAFGQAMKLKETEHGLIVYSIGPDMTDNGGAPFDQKTKTGDITFTVP